MAWSDETIAAALRSEPRLRGMARALLADPAEQDDVVQETLTRVAGKPPRESRALPSYLSTIFSNLIRERARASARRRKFERAAAPPRQLPSPDDVLDREHIRRVVVDAVRRLEEPYRSTVVWVFLEEVPAHELSVRLGVSDSTIRSRIHRALAKLRERLSGSFDEQGRNWRVAIAPLTVEPLGSAMIGVLEGTLIMKKLAITGAAVWAIVASWLLLDAQPPIPELPAAPSRPSASIVVADSGREGVEAVSTDVLREAAFERRGTNPGAGESRSAFDIAENACGYRGRLLDRNGSGAADGRVTVLEFDARLSPTTIDSVRDSVVRSISSACAADGTFVVTGLRVHALHLLVFEAAGDSIARVAERAPNRGERIDLGDVRIPRTSLTEGRVVDEDSRALVGAKVAVLPNVTRFDGLNELLWGLRNENLGRDSVLALERPNDDGETRFDAVALPPALAALAESLAPPIAITAADGTFSIRGFDANGDRLLLTHESSFARTIERTGGTFASESEFVLRAAPRFCVRVVDGRAEPVVGAEVFVGGPSIPGRTVHVLRRFGLTDAAGDVIGHAWSEGSILIAVRRTPESALVVTGPHAAHGTVRVDAPPISTFELQITRTDDGELEDFAFEAHRGNPCGELLALGLAGPRRIEPIPLGAGRFSCEALEAGDWLLRLSADGCAPTFVPVSLPRAGPLCVALAPAHELELDVVDRDGLPVAFAESELRSEQPEEFERTILPERLRLPHAKVLPRDRATSGNDGRLRFAGLAAGNYSVTIDHPRYARHEFVIEVPSPRSQVVLKPPSRVEGIVTEEGLAIASSRRLRIEHDVRWDRSPDKVVFVDTDASGRFECRGLPKGQYRVSAEIVKDRSPLAALEAMLTRNVPRRSVTRFVLEEGGYAFVHHEENPFLAAPDEPAVRVFGKITVDGRPLEGATVGVMNYAEFVSTGAEGMTDQTDAAGEYCVSQVVAPRSKEGTLTLSCFDATTGLRCRMDGVEVTGPEVRVDFVLATARLTGVVKGADGTPRACSVSVNGEVEGGGRYFDGIETDGLGRYEFRNLLAGTYDIQVFSREGNTTRRGVRVEPGDNRIDLEFFELNDIRGKVNLKRLGASDDSAITAVLMMDPPILNYWPRCQVGEDGSFSFSKVFAEKYDVCFVVEGEWYHGAEPVTLRGSAIDGLLIEPSPRDPPSFLMPSFPRKKSEIRPDPVDPGG